MITKILNLDKPIIPSQEEIKNLDDFHVWLFCILDPITMPY